MIQRSTSPIVIAAGLTTGYSLVTVQSTNGERIGRNIDPRVCAGCTPQAASLAAATVALDAAEDSYEDALNEYIACQMGMRPVKAEAGEAERLEPTAR